jgi:hypothetical protein
MSPQSDCPKTTVLAILDSFAIPLYEHSKACLLEQIEPALCKVAGVKGFSRIQRYMREKRTSDRGNKKISAGN